MPADASAIVEQIEVSKGKYDFSEHASVSNAAAPGDLIKARVTGRSLHMTDFFIYNAAAAAAVITFYDETSAIKLVVSVGVGETVAATLKSSIVYGEHDIYARTDQGVNAEVTISGKERILGV